MKYKVYRKIDDSYGGECIKVEAESIREAREKVENTPLTSEALSCVHWGIESIEEVR